MLRRGIATGPRAPTSTDPGPVPTESPRTITLLLHGARTGRSEAADQLFALVYERLKDAAFALFASQRNGHTLQPTALIHEAWMKLAGHLAGSSGEIQDRKHFFAIASRAMRQVLTDHARKARRQKRGDGSLRVTLHEQARGQRDDGVDLVDLEDTLARLATLNERHAQMIELRVLGGLTIPETAEILGLSHATVERDWFTVRSWLRRELVGS